MDSINSKKSAVSKPIYKKVWFWVIVIIVLIAIGGGANSGSQNNSSSNSTKTDTTKSEYTSGSKNDKSEEDAKKWTKSQYDALTTGDAMKNYAGGTPYSDVVAAHGEPSSKSDSSFNGTVSRTVSYDNFDSSDTVHMITLTFSGSSEDNLLLASKSQTGLE